MPTEPRKVINLRLSESGIAKLDEVRGSWSRSEYIRQAIKYAIEENKRGPQKDDW